MPFSESIKLSIRRRAHFRCCVCRAVGVEIHHIVPQEERGPDTADNAAPLCPSCHEIYGANSTKRKFLREARDFWFEICSNSSSATGLTVHDLSRELQTVASKQDIAKLRELIVGTQIKSDLARPHELPNNFVPVPLERYIQRLYEEDFGATPSMYELLFDSRTWSDEDDDSEDLLNRRAQFLEQYGEQTAKRICLVACRDAGIDPNGFTEVQLSDVINSVWTMVILITGHEKHSPMLDAFQCAQRQDGEFLWRVRPAIKRAKKKQPSDQAFKAAKPSQRRGLA